MSRPYSLLRHIGHSALFGAYKDWLPMAVFSAYFDASGNKRKSVLTVAGFVGRVKKWDRFDEEWSAILSDEGVSAMHMTDFASSQGEFTSWKGQSERRRKFIAQLCGCIRSNVNKGVASSVVISEYNDINAEFMLSENVGQPYTLSMRSCLGGLARWAKRKKIKTEHLLVFVEQGDEDQGELITWAASYDGFKVVPLPKGDVQAFQAGDMAAWKARTAVHNATFGPLASEDDAISIMRSLEPIRPIVQNNGVHGKEALLVMCSRHPIPRRRKHSERNQHDSPTG